MPTSLSFFSLRKIQKKIKKSKCCKANREKNNTFVLRLDTTYTHTHTHRERENHWWSFFFSISYRVIVVYFWLLSSCSTYRRFIRNYYENAYVHFLRNNPKKVLRMKQWPPKSITNTYNNMKSRVGTDFHFFFFIDTHKQKP